VKLSNAKSAGFKSLRVLTIDRVGFLGISVS
jgi:hypothetical protein